MRAIEFTKRKLMLQESVWRRECPKKRASGDHHKLSTRSWRHQKLKTSEVGVYQNLKTKAWSLLNVVILMHMIAKGMEAWRDSYFRGIRMHWMLIH